MTIQTTSKKELNVNLALIRFKKTSITEVNELLGTVDEDLPYYFDENYYYAGIYSSDLSLTAVEIVIDYSKTFISFISL